MEKDGIPQRLKKNLCSLMNRGLCSRLSEVLLKSTSQVFDVGRGESQGPEHINQLFQKKTCEGVLHLGPPWATNLFEPYYVVT